MCMCIVDMHSLKIDYNSLHVWGIHHNIQSLVLPPQSQREVRLFILQDKLFQLSILKIATDAVHSL